MCERRFSVVAGSQSNAENLYNHLSRHHEIQYELTTEGKPLLYCLLKVNKWVTLFLNHKVIEVFVRKVRIMTES